MSDSNLMGGAGPDEAAQGQASTQKIGTSTVPYGYEVWRNGVFVRKPSKDDTGAADGLTPSVDQPLPPTAWGSRHRVTTSPVWISGFGRAIDTGEKLVCLSVIDPHGHAFTRWCSREEIADKKGLIPLSALGVPVNAVNGGPMIEYLARAEAANAGMASELVGARAGYHKIEEGHGWLLGKRWIGPGKLAADPRDGGPFSSGFGKQGLYQDWLDRYQVIRESGAVARMTVAASFAAPLLRHLNCRTFFWFLYGSSKFGKTALQKFAMSVWGDPTHLKLSFNATQIGLVEAFHHISDLPLMVDERQAAGEFFDLGQLIYQVAMEEGRARGRRNGGVRQVARWKTILLANGEQQIISQDDRGGQRTRVLEIFVNRSRPLPFAANELHTFAETHYGAAGREYLEWLAPMVNNPTALERMRQRYNHFVSELAAAHPGKEEQARNVGVVAYAQALADWWLLQEDPERARTAALADGHEILELLSHEYTESMAERGMQVLRDHRLSNPSLYLRPNDPESRRREAYAKGVVGFELPGEGLFLVPSQVDKVLRDARLEPKLVWSDMVKLGYLRSLEETRHTVKRQIGGMRYRGYLVAEAAWADQYDATPSGYEVDSDAEDVFDLPAVPSAGDPLDGDPLAAPSDDPLASGPAEGTSMPFDSLLDYFEAAATTPSADDPLDG